MRSIKQIVSSIGFRLYYYCCPDKIYLNNKFRKVFGRDIDWKNPTTFNEKLQWLKIYDRNPLYTKLVDKYEVRKYIAEKIGEEYLIPCLGVWEHFEDINFNELPDQFVLKCTHDSNSVVVCRNKAAFDIENARKKLNQHLKMNFYYNAREWPYKNVKPRIIAEQYMEDRQTEELKDYKIFAFSGVAQALFIASDRQNPNEQVKFDFFDVNFGHLDIRQGHPNSAILPDKPSNLKEMISLAEKLSEEFPQVRVDFYECNEKTYFGEMTFFHHSGFVAFDPENWDVTFGSWIKLPDKNGVCTHK